MAINLTVPQGGTKQAPISPVGAKKIIMYTPQPSPIGTPTSSTGSPYSATNTPPPAPAPTTGSNPATLWNQQWNTLFNQAWNIGYNAGAKPTNSDPGLQAAIDQGYNQGFGARPKSGGTSSGATQQPSSQPTQQTPTQSGPSIDQQILDQAQQLYDSQIGAINNAENLLGQTKQTSLSGIATQSDQMGRTLESAYQQAMKQGTTQQDTLAHQTYSAQQENAQNLRNISQTILSRYGTGNSAGGGLTELATQSFYKTSGDLQTKATAALQTIFDAQNQALQTYNLGKQKLQEDVVQQTKAVEDDYSAKLLALENQKIQSAGAKQSLQINLLQQYQSRMENLAQAAQQQATQLTAFLAQSQLAATGSTAAINDLVKNLVAQSNQYLGAIGELPKNALISPNYNQASTPNTSIWNPGWFSSSDNKDQINSIFP